MVTVRNQRSTVDLSPNSDTKYCNRFVANKTHDSCGGNNPYEVYVSRVHKPVKRLVSRNQSAPQYDEDNRYSSKVFDSTQSVSKPLARGFAGKEKRNPEGDCREGVSDVVDGISEQRNAPDMRKMTNWARAVTPSPTKDHLIAQIPRLVVAMTGSTTPWL